MPDETWEVLRRETILRHPYVTVAMEHVWLPGNRSIHDWPIIQTRDYVNVVVLNEAGQMLVLEGYKHGVGHSSWQVVGGYLEEGEDPLAAAQRELLEETGYASDQWQPLGSFVVDANRRVGVGHFFLARHARQVAEATYDDLEQIHLMWVSPDEVRQALLDGRVKALAYAANIALALLVM